MCSKIEISYIEATMNDKRLKRIAEILSEGVYSSLKKKERPNKNPKRKALIEKTLAAIREGVPGIDNKIEKVSSKSS